jgi:hypothetical protein
MGSTIVVKVTDMLGEEVLVLSARLPDTFKFQENFDLQATCGLDTWRLSATTRASDYF